jgi:hypothetical protein
MSEVFTSIPYGRFKNRCELRTLDRQHLKLRLRLRWWVWGGVQLHGTNLGQPHEALGRWHIMESHGIANHSGPQPCNIGCRMRFMLMAALCRAE